MTDEESADGGIADPIVSWGSIPGAGGTAAEPADAGAENTSSSGSAYEQVRGLLSEPGPRVGTSRLSEKMVEEMESFDQRWSQRPVSALVSAGKKMLDQSDSFGLNRLLGLPTPTPPAGVVPDLDSAALPENSATTTTTDIEVDSAVGEINDLGDGIDDTEPASTASTADVESMIEPFEGDEVAPLRAQASEESGACGSEPESSEDQTMPITPTTRMAAAQEAYAALNPLEAEIFRSQAGLVDSAQALQASTRSQELALDALNNYERETIDLRQQLVTVRTEADTAAQEAATRNEVLTAKVATLEGQLELAAAELVAARRAAADGGDDSEGGAGRELVKGRDDLRTHDEETQSAEIADESVEDEADDTYSEEEHESESFVEEISIETQDEDGDEGDDGMLQELQRLALGHDEPTSQPNFGD